jgi:hypothetical protein
MGIMSLADRIMSLDSDDVYVTLMRRMEKATTEILNGAGNEEDWITLFNQLRTREQEVLGL